MTAATSGPLKERRALWLGLRTTLFLYFVAVTCPIQFFYFEDYLDLSWVLAINVAEEQSLKFGENFFWTYGPFAYLGSPLPVGDNLREALLMQSALWAAAAAVGFDLFFIQMLPLGGLLALSLSAAMAWPLFHFNFGGVENSMVFLAFLSLASSLRRRRWLPGFALASMLCGLAAMFKLSAAMLIAGSLLGAGAVMIYRSKRDGFTALAVAGTIAPLSFVGSYWLYNPSLAGLRGYIWGLGEYSSGYSTAMSAAAMPLNLVVGAAAEVCLCLALLLHERRRNRDGSFALIVMFLLPLGMSWKHMIVRLDFFHLPAFFSMAALVIGILIAFRERPSPKPGIDILAYVLSAIVILFLTQPVMAFWAPPATNVSAAWLRVLSGRTSVQHLGYALDIGRAKTDLLRESAAHLEGRHLPAGIRERIGLEPIGFFGSNYAFAVVDKLKLRLAPIPQIYAAFTPALDQLWAGWIRDDGPTLLLMDWSYIDGRHPLTQTPRSWLEVWRSYDTELFEGEWLLLKRRQAPRFGDPIPLGPNVVQGDETIAVPSSTGPLLVAVRRPLSWTGRLDQTFYRVPPIMQRYRQGDNAVSHRAILDNLDYPTMVRPLPGSLSETALLLSPAAEAPTDEGPSEFSFVGAEDDYVNEYEAEFYELPINSSPGH
jgi:hypothetical protein